MKMYQITILCLLLVPFSTTNAGEKEDALITKITAAYGGQPLIDLYSYRIEEHYISPAVGQSNSPKLTDIGESLQILNRDIKNKQIAYDNWFTGRGGNNQNLTIGDDDKAYNINFATGTFGDANSADPYQIAGGTMRTSDTILVYELNKVKDKAVLGEDVRYMSRPHHTLTMPFPSSPDLKLLVDAETFLISKMVRNNPQLGDLDYVFSDYQQHNGITFASSTVFSISGAPNLISTRRDLQFNVEIPSEIFVMPAQLKPEGERIDASEMVVNKLSDRVYHVGQNGGFSLFIDTNIGTVGVGGYAALPTRLARYQKESGSFKPLTHQIVTHHHSDHLGAVSEAVGLGAKLVTVSDNVEAINASASNPLDSRDVLTMSTRLTLGEGRERVEVYEVSTIHANSNLVTYVPSTRTVFIADHFGTPFANALPVAGKGTVDMLKALDKLNLNIKNIATAHNARIFSMQELRDSVAAYKPTVCSGARPVCK